MKKLLLLSFAGMLLAASGYSQTNRFWSADNENKSQIEVDKATLRQAYPKVFKLFRLNSNDFRQQLFSVVNQGSKKSTIISLPNAAGMMEDFEVTEASNFEPALQERFPDIRSFSGKGITDKGATLKLSVSPQGIETMIFRAEKDNEFIEPYSKDHSIYSVFTSQRDKSKLPWKCNTPEEKMATSLNQKVESNVITGRSGGNLKTLRLAQSVTAEYSNYFGATSASQVGLVLAAVNNTLTRCNGVYEKDLALHLNLISNTTDVFYYNPATDPYANSAQGVGLGRWNSQLQKTLTSVIGASNYDIGHLFGASGGGGNAGCIGCICEDNSKGSGITSPADAIPEGDNFDIDYVVHEVGHQLGANHTFSYSSEGTGVNVEIGSGITIMGYAGITSYDVAPHSIDIYHAASIAQIQSNLNSKTCPVTTAITNSAPVVASIGNFTIPVGTPFALTGSATDANAGNILTYCWEENDDVSGQTGAKSTASPTKTAGPNWISFKPTTSPTRLFPELSTILTGDSVTASLPGGDANTKIEALSSVARKLNFRLTVRDNAVYSTTAAASVGQTNFTDMVVTVSAASGPFKVTAPNTAVTWAGGSTQTITWDVAGTIASPVSCANVKISLSTDGGQTFPTVLAASTPNDGSQAVTIPGVATSTARIKIESVGNIFFDISNADFTIGQSAPDCSAAFEPNETQATAASIQLSATNTAAISSATDIDYYKIINPAKGTLTAKLVGPSGVNYDVYIYSANGRQVAKSTGATATETASVANRIAGTFYVKVIGKNGVFSSQCYTLTVTSVPNSGLVAGNDVTARNATISMTKTDAVANVSVYPNPAHNELRVNMGNYTDAVSILVTDMHGTKVSSKTFSGSASINMSKMAAGVYMVIIRDKNGDIIKQSRIMKD